MCRCKSRAVQTGVDVGLHYSWPRGSAEAVASTQYGLAFVEPSSVATAVVSADALEGMCLYILCAVPEHLTDELLMIKRYTNRHFTYTLLYFTDT